MHGPCALSGACLGHAVRVLGPHACACDARCVQDQLKHWRGKISCNSQEWEDRNTSLLVEKKAMSRHYASLKGTMDAFRAAQGERLKQLSLQAHAAELELQAVITQAEGLLKLAEMCRGLESEQVRFIGGRGQGAACRGVTPNTARRVGTLCARSTSGVRVQEKILPFVSVNDAVQLPEEEASRQAVEEELQRLRHMRGDGDGSARDAGVQARLPCMHCAHMCTPRQCAVTCCLCLGMLGRHRCPQLLPACAYVWQAMSACMRVCVAGCRVNGSTSLLQVEECPELQEATAELSLAQLDDVPGAVHRARHQRRAAPRLLLPGSARMWQRQRSDVGMRGSDRGAVCRCTAVRGGCA
jgi:hypothetical protein